MAPSTDTAIQTNKELGIRDIPYLRAEPAPDDAIVMLRAGERGLVTSKLEQDARRSERVIGIRGISVIAGFAGETLMEVWEASPLATTRLVVWWSTAGRLRAAGFPLLPTGRDPRHFTVVLETLEVALLEWLAAQFTCEVKT